MSLRRGVPLAAAAFILLFASTTLAIKHSTERRRQAPNGSGTKNVFLTNINYHTGSTAAVASKPAATPPQPAAAQVGAAPAAPAVSNPLPQNVAPNAASVMAPKIAAPQAQLQQAQPQPQQPQLQLPIPPQIQQPLTLPRNNSPCPDTGPCSMAPALIVDHLTGHTPFVKSVVAISHGDEALLAALANDPVSRKISQQMNDMRGRIASNAMWVEEVKKITDYYQKASKAVATNVNDAKRAYTSMQRVLEQRLRTAKQSMLDRKMRLIQEAAMKSREKAQGLREESNMIREKLSRPLSPQVIEQLMLAPRLNDQQLEELGRQKAQQEQREDTQALLNNCNNAANRC